MNPYQILMAAWVAKAARDGKRVETNFQWDAFQEVFDLLDLGSGFEAEPSDDGYLVIIPINGHRDYYDPSGAIACSYNEGRNAI